MGSAGDVAIQQDDLLAQKGPFPYGGFNYPLPPRSTLNMGGKSVHPAPYENGYPIEGWQTEEMLGNPNRYSQRRYDDMQPQYGDGQVAAAPPIAPPEPPRATPYNPNDYGAPGSETVDTRDYAKPPVVKNPLPVSPPKPYIEKIVAGEGAELVNSCAAAIEKNQAGGSGSRRRLLLVDLMERVLLRSHTTGRSGGIAISATRKRGLGRRLARGPRGGPDGEFLELSASEAGEGGGEGGGVTPAPAWITIEGENLGQNEVSDVQGVHLVLVTRDGEPLATVPCLNVKTGLPPGKEEEQAEAESGEEAAGEEGDGEESGEEAGSTESGEEAGDESGEEASGGEVTLTAFGGDGTLSERILKNSGLGAGRRRRLLGDDGGGGEAGGEVGEQIVNGVNTVTGRIQQLSCMLPPYPGPDAFGYIQVHTTSMGNSDSPSMDQVTAGTGGEAAAGSETKACTDEGPRECWTDKINTLTATLEARKADGLEVDTTLPAKESPAEVVTELEGRLAGLKPKVSAAVNFCCNKCPPSQAEINKKFKADQDAAREAASEAAAAEAAAESEAAAAESEADSEAADDAEAEASEAARNAASEAAEEKAEEKAEEEAQAEAEAQQAAEAEAASEVVDDSVGGTMFDKAVEKADEDADKLNDEYKKTFPLGPTPGSESESVHDGVRELLREHVEQAGEGAAQEEAEEPQGPEPAPAPEPEPTEPEPESGEEAAEPGLSEPESGEEAVEPESGVEAMEVDECPPGTCPSSLPNFGCEDGAKRVHLSEPDPAAKDRETRCCGESKCVSEDAPPEVLDGTSESESWDAESESAEGEAEEEQQAEEEVACAPNRPYFDAELGHCRRKRAYDCPGYSLPRIYSQVCTKGKLTEATFAKLSREACNMYFSGLITYREMTEIVTDIVDMNPNKGKPPPAYQSSNFKKLAGYIDIMTNWPLAAKSPKLSVKYTGDNKGENWMTPQHCKYGVGNEPRGDCDNAQCDPDHQCPQLEPDVEGVGGGPDVYVTKMSETVWKDSCSLNGNDWKCGLRIPLQMKKPGAGVPVPLPRFPLSAAASKKGNYFVCTTPWVGDADLAMLRKEGKMKRHWL